MWSKSDILSQHFFSGDYEVVLRSAAAEPAAVTHPAAIGALAMAGRLEEAVLAARRAQPLYRSREELAASRLFLCMGYCHAGRYDEARKLAACNVRRISGAGPFIEFLGWQSAALVRYFEGRMRLAARTAEQALASALASRVPYARLIALELRGHVLVQVGQLPRGLRALEDAETLAAELEFAANAHTMRVSRLIYMLRVPRRRQAAATALLTLLEAPDVSRFARRNALLELATVAAMEGRGTDASTLWERARMLSLESDDDRGTARVAGVGAALATLRGEEPKATALWAEAERRSRDAPGLAIETAYLRAVVGEDVDGARIEELWRTTGIARARMASELAAQQPPSLPWDWPAMARHPHATAAERVEAAAAHDALGLLTVVELRSAVRESLVEQRVLLAGAAERDGRDASADSCALILTDDEWFAAAAGNVLRVAAPSDRGAAIVAALCQQPQSNEALLARVWAVRAYNATLHDSTIQKAVSRLRARLGERGVWILTTADGYALRADVEVIDLRSEPASATRERMLSSTTRSEGDPVRAAMRLLGDFTSGALAERLRVSPASALRLLRPLVESGLVIRSGRGKNTRYRLNQKERG